MDRVRTSITMDNSSVVNSEGKSGGLILLWPRDLMVSIRSFLKGHNDCTVQPVDVDPCLFTGFYGNPKPHL